MKKTMYGIYDDLGALKMQKLDNQNTEDNFLFKVSCEVESTITQSWIGKVETYTFLDNESKRTFMEKNNWRTASSFRTNDRAYPNQIKVDIADPDGDIQQMTVFGGSPHFPLLLWEKLSLICKYPNWKEFHRDQEINTLKKENEALRLEVEELKSEIEKCRENNL